MHCQLCSMDNHVNNAAAAQQGHCIYEAQLLGDSHVILLEVWAGWTCVTKAMLPYQPALTAAMCLLQLNMASSLLLAKPTHDSWVDPMKVHGVADNCMAGCCP